MNTDPQAKQEIKCSEPDRLRWGNPSSYRPKWNKRARFVASLMPDNVSVLEIGVGTGLFRELVKGRTRYLGVDLQPLDPETIALDIEADPLPKIQFDYAVLLGVYEYLHKPEAATRKLCAAADRIIVSYCCKRAGLASQLIKESWQRRGWVTEFTKNEFIRMFVRNGHELASCKLFKKSDKFELFVMEFRRSG